MFENAKRFFANFKPAISKLESLALFAGSIAKRLAQNDSCG